ncbi:hypothetical protein [Vibrio sp. 1291-1]|uniref:hypothetical protein n=1 Tax=Vibrio sp. 1291-1 TaxID=3074551 RepID=UPI00296B0F2C|nr:hypothetical protein [Vibrio sp. 1291-1]MDW3640249.1 hypothetical protein [Vibrio sp. 1291-1]
MDDFFKSFSIYMVEEKRDELLTEIRRGLNQQVHDLSERYLEMDKNELIAKMRYEGMPCYSDFGSIFNNADGRQLVKHFVFTRVVLLDNVAFKVVKKYSKENTCYGVVKYEDTALKEDINTLQEKVIDHVTEKICQVHGFDGSQQYIYQRSLARN